MSEQNVWIVADTHFNPNGIESYVRRPERWNDGREDYNHRFCKMWAANVKDNDIVYHLGDVVIDAFDKVRGILESLPGQKHLIMGNHDRGKTPLWWMRNGFVSAAYGVLYERIWLSHEPAPFLPPFAKVNVHGHCHQNRRSWGQFKNFNYFLCHEYGDYAPVQLEKFVSKYHKKYSVLRLDPASPDHKLPW
jgi:calcineurin-like phosphoesterase family protein